VLSADLLSSLNVELLFDEDVPPGEWHPRTVRMTECGRLGSRSGDGCRTSGHVSTCESLVICQHSSYCEARLQEGDAR